MIGFMSELKCVGGEKSSAECRVWQLDSRIWPAESADLSWVVCCVVRQAG